MKALYRVAPTGGPNQLEMELALNGVISPYLKEP